jgi:transposase
MPRLLDYASLIQESCEELLHLEKTHQKSYLRDRVRFLRFLKEGRVKSQSASGHLIGLSSRQSKNLWLKYKEKGISYFIQPRVNQNWGKLSSIQISTLLKHLDKDTTLTQSQVQKYIADNFGETLSQPSIHYLFKRLKVKLKTGRPSNIRQDPKAREDFKKNFL